MEDDFKQSKPLFSHAAESFSKVPQPSESFGKVPHPSAPFGTVPQDAESFRNVPHGAERRENHTLSVRDAVRMFEAAGVARAERSIVNWCQQNRQGVARLDAYLDPNERRYFITPESVDRAIQEELSKRSNSATSSDSQEIKGGEKKEAFSQSADLARIRELEADVRNWKISGEVKDRWIDQLLVERDHQLKKLIELSHQVGKLGGELNQLPSPNQTEIRD